MTKTESTASKGAEENKSTPRVRGELYVSGGTAMALMGLVAVLVAYFAGRHATLTVRDELKEEVAAKKLELETAFDLEVKSLRAEFGSATTQSRIDLGIEVQKAKTINDETKAQIAALDIEQVSDDLRANRPLTVLEDGGDGTSERGPVRRIVRVYKDDASTTEQSVTVRAIVDCNVKITLEVAGHEHSQASVVAGTIWREVPTKGGMVIAEFGSSSEIPRGIPTAQGVAIDKLSAGEMVVYKVRPNKQNANLLATTVPRRMLLEIEAMPSAVVDSLGGS